MTKQIETSLASNRGEKAILNFSLRRETRLSKAEIIGIFSQLTNSLQEMFEDPKKKEQLQGAPSRSNTFPSPLDIPVSEDGSFVGTKEVDEENLPPPPTPPPF